MKNEIKEYSLARVILILMVLFGHIVIHNAWNPVYGGVRYDELLYAAGYSDSTIHIICVKISGVLYQFHMAAFLALSGALFKVSFQRYKSFSDLLVRKAKRLVIPFVVLTLCYSSVIKYFTGAFVPGVPLKVSVLDGQLFLLGNNYLWYLWVLFLVTLLVYLIEKLPVHNVVKLALVFLMNISRGVITPKFGFYMVFEDIFWFYIGFLFEAHRTDVDRFIIRRPYMTLLAAICLVMIKYSSSHLNVSALRQTFYYLSAWLGMYFVYSFAALLCRHPVIRDNRFVSMISANGMGIYIYSDPLNYIITFLFVRIWGIAILSGEVSSMVLLTVKMLATLMVPILICKILRKYNVRYLV